MTGEALATAKNNLTKEIQDAIGRFGDLTRDEPEIVHFEAVDEVLDDIHSGVAMRLDELKAEQEGEDEE